ncbi:MAG: uracil-DNA glycosylase [Firmicutes bacterium]|nr:uracil-DNA glycosylase [Bacillota bacterium]
MTTWEELEQMCLNCRGCRLCETRNNVVIGVGNKNADIMFVGEGPGYHEDMQGEPFVGAAGQLLDKMLAAVGLDRSIVYIANVVKCRPPNNRNPEQDEQDACINYLRRQYLLIRPKIIVCLGKIAASALIEQNFPITRDHGVWYSKKDCEFIATFHPSALLRDESKKRIAWEDLKKIKQKYDELKSEDNK